MIKYPVSIDNQIEQSRKIKNLTSNNSRLLALCHTLFSELTEVCGKSNITISEKIISQYNKIK